MVSAGFALTSALNLIFFIFAFSRFTNEVSRQATFLDPQAQSFILEHIQSKLTYFGQIVMAFNLFSLIVSFFLGILFLNHIAGPVYAAQKTIADMAQGKHIESRLVLRKFDFFTELADSVNLLIDKLKSERDKKQTP